MKKLSMLLLFFTVALSGLQAQQKKQATFRITEARHNGYDRTEYYDIRKQYLAFYVNGEGEFSLASVSDVKDEQSYGPLTNAKMEEIEETDENYGADVFTFRWKYRNSYDQESGYATVRFMKVYRDNGIIFTLTVIMPNLDVDVYEGYMDGTLRLKQYF